MLIIPLLKSLMISGLILPVPKDIPRSGLILFKIFLHLILFILETVKWEIIHNKIFFLKKFFFSK